MEKIQQDNNQGAIQDLNKAIELNPNDSKSCDVRGLAKMQLGDYLGG